jgi:hypothetical protein
VLRFAEAQAVSSGKVLRGRRKKAEPVRLAVRSAVGMKEGRPISISSAISSGNERRQPQFRHPKY